jgi:hypothetical protein
MAVPQATKFYLGLSIGFVLCASAALAGSIWQDAVAMLAVSICSALLYFGICRAALPLIISLAWAFINQSIGLYHVINYWKPAESSNDIGVITFWLNIFLSTIFIGVCSYAIYVTLKKLQST